MKELDDILQHHGVKGMKWGVVRSKVGSAGSAVKKSISKASNVAKKGSEAVKTRVREEVKSGSREIGWRRELRNIHKLSNQELQGKVDRVRMENELKSLANKQKVRNVGDLVNKSGDKKTYRNREAMSDKQLREKVEQLRLKDSLRKQISHATKEHRESANKMIDDVGKAFPSAGAYSEIGKQLIDHSYGRY